MSSIRIPAAEIQVGDIVTSRSGHEVAIETARTMKTGTHGYRILAGTVVGRGNRSELQLRGDVEFDVTRTD